MCKSLLACVTILRNQLELFWLNILTFISNVQSFIISQNAHIYPISRLLDKYMVWCAEQ